MKHFHRRWIPHQLTEQLRAARLEKSQGLPPLLEAKGGKSESVADFMTA
jgi:hypothetical protein